MNLQLVYFWLACSALLLFPGALLARLAPTLSTRLRAGERILPAFLLSAGYLGLVWAIASAVRPTLLFAGCLWAAGCVALAGLALLVSHREKRPGPAPHYDVSRPPLLPPADRLPTVLALLICALALVTMLHQGGSLGYIHDSLDFVAFVRRMLDSGRIDIVSAAYKVTEGMGPDPRRGAFHVGMALVCAITATPADVMWRSLPVVLVPLSLWIFYASTRRIVESAASAALALLFLAGALLFQPEQFLQNLAYASRLGWVYSWVGVWAVALFLDADRADKSPPDDWSRAARAKRGLVGRGALALAIAGAPILVAVHVLSAVQYLASLAGFAWIWALSRREPRPIRRHLALLPLLALAALIPALVLKMMGSYSAANPIFDHPQGLLYLWDEVALLTPRHFSAWFGWPGLLGVLLILPMIPRALQRRDFAYAVGGTAVAALVLLNPVAVAVLEKFKAHSLLFRVMLVVPHFATLGIFAAWSLRRIRHERPGRRWIAPMVFLLLAGTLLTLNAREASRFFSVPEFRRGPWVESRPLLRALEFLQEREPDPQVVVSDPITSYQIPAYSRHHAIAPFNQHSSPADHRAVERIYDAHAIFNAYVPLARTVELLRFYQADYVLLNQSFPRYVRFYFTFIAPEAWPAELAKFTQAPNVFEPVYDADGVRIFRFHDPGVAATWGETVNPYRLLAPPESAGVPAAELARRLGVQPVSAPSVGGLEMVGVVWDSTTFRAGTYVKIRSFWRRTTAAATLPVDAFFRVTTEYPNSHFRHRWYGKPYRRLYEKQAGLTYRFGRMHQPLEAFFPPYLWEVGAVYWDEFWIPAPRHAAPGEYQVTVKLVEVPYTPNYRLTDYLRVEDSLEGTVIGRIAILPPSD